MKHLPFITIEIIPHNAQEYDTCGNYQEVEKNSCCIEISKLNNWKKEACVAIHELVEYILVKKNGIKINDIDNFDINFQGKGEPGNSKDAPYNREHLFATKIEKLLAKELGVSWSEYDKAINNLKYE